MKTISLPCLYKEILPYQFILSKAYLIAISLLVVKKGKADTPSSGSSLALFLFVSF